MIRVLPEQVCLDTQGFCPRRLRPEARASRRLNWASVTCVTNNNVTSDETVTGNMTGRGVTGT